MLGSNFGTLFTRRARNPPKKVKRIEREMKRKRKLKADG
jgi:hypothetical protein